MQLIIINIYRSPLGCINTFHEKLECILNDTCKKYNKYKTVVVGDFNINFLDQSKAKNIINLFGSYNLTQVIHGATSHKQIPN